MTALSLMPTLGTTESGGLIKMRRTLHNGGRATQAAEIVLAFLPHNDVTPFATWQRNTDEPDGRGTYWGHYFSDPDEALADFDKRGR